MSEQQRNGSSSKLGGQSFLIIFITSISTTLVTLFILNLHFQWDANISMMDRGNCFDLGDHSWCGVARPLDSAGLVSVLSDFYTNIIVILIAILALVTTLATISIRFSARQQIENELPDHTETFFESSKGTMRLEQVLVSQFSDMRKQVEDQEKFVNEILDRMSIIEDRLEWVDSGDNVLPPDDDEE